MFDVVVVGYGPVGAILANTLGRDGHKVLVVDQMTDIYDKPRAINIDHELMRTLQSVGLAEAVDAITLTHPGTDFIGLDGRLIKVFEPVEPPYLLHWGPNVMFIQPEFEPILRAGVARFPSVTVRLGTEVLSLEDGAETVTVALRDAATGQRSTATARYLVACDGASSPIRKRLGIGQDSLDFDEWWTVVDALLKRPTPLPRRTTQFCWPHAPTTYVVGPRDLRRWELKLMPGETPKDYEDPAAVRRRLAPFVDPDAIDLWRVATYRFHALVAHDWRRGRVFLAGDAAHQMPPFMAQGLCSGVRDVANLGWKLSGVLRGAVPEAILDTYETERKPHIRDLVATAKQLGEIIGELDVEAARRRDQMLGDQLEGGTSVTVRQKLIPDLRHGLIALGADAQPTASGGQLFPQPVVLDHQGRQRLFDDLVGARFSLVTRGSQIPYPGDIEDALGLGALGSVRLHLMDDGEAPSREGDFTEADGLLRRWMEERGAAAVIVRPDKYVYGTAGDRVALAPLVSTLQADLFGAAARAGAAALIVEHAS